MRLLATRLFMLAAAAGVASCAEPDAHVPAVAALSPAAVRVQAPGAEVQAEGVVTVAPGTLGDGFAIQDATGGVYVHGDAGAPPALGDSVRISGTLEAVDGQFGIRAEEVRVLGRGTLPRPLDVATGAAGDATEGRLIRIRGTVTGDVQDDAPWGWKLHVDDGSGPLLVFVATPAAIDVTGIRAGQRLEVTGYSGRYEEHHEILPRSAADVRVLTLREPGD